MVSKKIWLEILEYARWSPSPHNIQPWKIKIITENEAELYYVPERLLPVEDYTGCFTIASLGIFIENLSIAASEYGLKVEEEYNDILLDENRTSPVFFAKLLIKKTSIKENLNRKLIKERRTSRLQYSDKPVDNRILSHLKKVAKVSGHILETSTDPELIDWILKLNCDTLFDDMDNEKTRNEVSKWLRYSSDEAKGKKDGLWAYCLNVPSAALFVFFKQKWVINIPILNTIFKTKYLQTTKGTKTVAWLTGPFNNPQEWLKAGHMLARLWLTMTKYGIYLHPFGSIITNKNSHAKVRNKFKVDEDKTPLWLLLRLGQSEVPPRSLRLNIQDLILN